LLDKTNHKLWSLVTAYCWHRKLIGNWQWFDDINKTDWEPKQIALLLCIAYLGELGFLEPVDSLFLPLEAENHSPMTTQLSEICDVGQLIYTMHPTAAYDLARLEERGYE
jgi:hypothetical protein